jgi:ADP-ribosylation factor-like protein 2-binding protein
MDSDDLNTKIFNSICDLIAKPEFTEFQAEFYKTYQSKFDPEEENKLEYTPIYETYVELTDKMIDMKLKTDDGYTDQQLADFKDHFKENMPKYEEINSDVVDILFGYVDFQKFKRVMLTYRKGMIDQEFNQEELE